MIRSKKRKLNGIGQSSDYEEPTYSHLQNNRKILLASENKHNTVRDLYLDDNHVNGLICGVAAFVSRKGIRKIAVLPSIFCTILEVDRNADPVRYMEIYKDGYDVLLAVIASDEHWYIATFFIEEKIVVVLDSLHWPLPAIFGPLKASVESVLHIQFRLRNENHNVSKQKNGYDCGVHAFRNAEEICFHGKCNLLVPYHAEAERARAREILRKLADKEITDEWVSAVENSTDFVGLNKPTDDIIKEITGANDTSDVEIIEPDDIKNNNLNNVIKKSSDASNNIFIKNEKNVCDITIGDLNDPVQNMGINDSMEVDKTIREEKQGFKLLSAEEEERLKKELSEKLGEFCKRKKIKNDGKGKQKYNEYIKNVKHKIDDNEKLKACIKNKQNFDEILMENDDNLSQDCKLMPIDEESRLQKEVNETFTEFCRRLKISKSRSKNKYNDAIKSAQEKLAENERLREYMNKKRLTESVEERQERLSKVAEKMKDLRNNQTEEEKNVRLEKDAKLKQKNREKESEKERSQRLNIKKNQMAINRAIVKIEKEEELKRERAKRVKNANEISSFIRRKGATIKDVEPFRLGKRDQICNGCGAKHYRTEKRQKDGTFTSCCQQGKVKMQVGATDYPKLFKDLMTKKHGNKEFVKLFDLERRTINSSLSCAHMYAKNVKLAPGVPCLKIQGKVLHKMPMTYLPSGDNKTFGGQNYVVDSGTATIARIEAATKMSKKLSVDLMTELDETMRKINIFAQSYKMLKDTVEKEKAEQEVKKEKPRELRLLFKGNPNAPRNYDRVEAENEIALVFTPGPEGEVPRDDIVIYDKKEGNKVSEYLRSWDPRVEPLTYPLFYPMGNETVYTSQLRDPKDPKSGKLTEREYFNFKFQDRDEEKYGFNPFLYGGKLYLQYLCDAWAKVENSRLQWYKNNQKQIRAASYQEVHEHLNKKAQEIGKAPGTVKILPSTFYGGPRYLRELCSDAISMVDEYGRPTTMITMTVNPEDEDIIMNLYEDQKSWERPDVINSCFYQKMHELIRVIEKEQIFGEVICSVVVVEFQKRGLPHCHCVFTLKEKWDTVEKVDANIRAYFPPMSQEEADGCEDEEYDEVYLELMKKFCIHRPCGIYNPKAPCMVNGKCKRGFPRQCTEHTKMDENGFTVPKRPKNKRSFIMKVNGKDVEVDNRWVVPHNPYLLKYMKCHINVEAINSIATVFYVFKYMFKGDDKALVEMNEYMDNEVIRSLNYDEINSYEDFRYISACEAHWRLSDFWMYRLSHSVDRLPVHLENEQTIYMGENPDEKEMANAKNKDSKLMAFFKTNKKRKEEIERVKETIEKLKAEKKPVNHIKIPEKILYNKIGISHVWEGKTAQWNPRKKTTKPKICRLYNVNPKRTNCFYLRRLLMAVPGPLSFEDLRTVDGVLYETNREACVALGLVLNDKLYEDTLFESLNHTTSNQFRYLFARLLAHCDLGDPLELFDRFEDHLISDLLRKWSKEDAKKVAWRKIVKSMQNQDKQLSDYPKLEAYMDEIGFENEESIDLKALLEGGWADYSIMNKEQKAIVDPVIKKIESKEQKLEKYCSFVDGPGGCGKSYTFNAIRKIALGSGKNVMIMAWSGIAASLYPMGRTCHNGFKLDFPFESDSNSGIKPNSPQGQMLKELDIIIWDELPMAPKRALEVVDSKLREIMKNDIPFGGKIFLSAGDFRQVAPIVENGTRQETINTSVCCSRLWKEFEKFQLTENMRALPEEVEFKKMLLEIGEGRFGDKASEIEIPQECLSKGDIIDEIFGDIMENYDPATVMKRAILATWNKDVDELNEQVIELFDEETEKIYHAQDVYHYGDEILQGAGEVHENYKIRNIKGLPSFKLRLRKNAIVMLVRNLSIEDGLCNGTRLVVTNLLKHNLVVKKINIDGSLSDDIFIPRITLTAKHGVVEVTRHQFPVKLAFCMTINKSQGQTFDKVGVILNHECFSHGQLYVALSRVRSISGLKIVLSEGKTSTANIVYKELLELGKK